MKHTLLMVLLSLLLTQCHWFKKDTPSPLEQLPGATQAGKNTFGCLINGQPWTPKGFNGTPNYNVYYDPTYRNGTLNISTYRYPNKDNDDVQYLTIYSDSLTAPGVYPLTVPNRQEAIFSDTKTGCYFMPSESYFRAGNLTITKLDLTNGIISGTFEFTLAKPGCDTIRVTDGRFDKKL